MVFLVNMVKMDKVLMIFIKNLHLVPSTALLDPLAQLVQLVALVFVVCADLRDPLASLEMMASLVPLENKDPLVLQELMANPDKLETKVMMLKNQLPEKVPVEILVVKEMKEHKVIKDQLEPLVNLVRLDLLVLQASKALLDLMVILDQKVALVPLVMMLNTVPAPIVMEVDVVPMVEHTVVLVAMEVAAAVVPVLEIMEMVAETAAVAAMLVVTVKSVFK